MPAGVSKYDLLIECGSAETRGALLSNNEVIRWLFGPARGDETAARAPEAGDVFLGRVKTIAGAMAGAFVDIGEEREAMLSLGKAPAPTEGAAVIVGVRRPPIGEKGALLTAEWRRGLSKSVKQSIETEATQTSPPRRLHFPPDAALAMIEAVGAKTLAQVVIDAPALKSALEKKWPSIEARYDPSPFMSAELSHEIEDAFERVVALPGGARVIIDETEGLSVVDVDAGSIIASDGKSVNDKVNTLAARALFTELSRRAIGGRVIVDFLPPSNAKARATLIEQLRVSAAGVFDGRFGKLTEDGVFDISAPRKDLTILERASIPAGEGWARPGRAFTLDWRAKTLLRTLEGRLASVPSLRPRVLIKGEVGAYLDDHKNWTDRLAERFGGRAQFEISSALKDRDFDIVE